MQYQKWRARDGKARVCPVRNLDRIYIFNLRSDCPMFQSKRAMLQNDQSASLLSENLQTPPEWDECAGGVSCVRVCMCAFECAL